MMYGEKNLWTNEWLVTTVSTFFCYFEEIAFFLLQQVSYLQFTCAAHLYVIVLFGNCTFIRKGG